MRERERVGHGGVDDGVRVDRDRVGVGEGERERDWSQLPLVGRDSPAHRRAARAFIFVNWGGIVVVVAKL